MTFLRKPGAIGNTIAEPEPLSREGLRSNQHAFAVARRTGLGFAGVQLKKLLENVIGEQLPMRGQPNDLSVRRQQSIVRKPFDHFHRSRHCFPSKLSLQPSHLHALIESQTQKPRLFLLPGWTKPCRLDWLRSSKKFSQVAGRSRTQHVPRRSQDRIERWGVCCMQCHG